MHASHFSIPKMVVWWSKRMKDSLREKKSLMQVHAMQNTWESKYHSNQIQQHLEPATGSNLHV